MMLDVNLSNYIFVCSNQLVEIKYVKLLNCVVHFTKFPRKLMCSDFVSNGVVICAGLELVPMIPK